MSDWIPVERWSECRQMERPGVVFELRNRVGQHMITACVDQLPAPPFDWRDPVIEFRVIDEPPVRRSDPLPAPAR